jgi:hypothetical protein
MCARSSRLFGSHACARHARSAPLADRVASLDSGACWIRSLIGADQRERVVICRPVAKLGSIGHPFINRRDLAIGFSSMWDDNFNL